MISQTMNSKIFISASVGSIDKRKEVLWLFLVLCIMLITPINTQSLDSVEVEEVTFENEGITLVGNIHKPMAPEAGLVIVHGSGQTARMTEFATELAESGFMVLTYDKRGVGESGGVYAGPEVGTNNVDSANLSLLAEDASVAVNTLRSYNKNMPIGLIGFSQAGWVIPIAANQNPRVDFMVLFSCPLITTLEQLRFQFYTDGRTDFWENHTEADARSHIRNDPDRYQFTGTDPRVALRSLSIPGLWLFGGKDIQIPATLCIEQLNLFKEVGKPFEYTLFPSLGHNTAFADNTMPVDIAIHWIRRKAAIISREKGIK